MAINKIQNPIARPLLYKGYDLNQRESYFPLMNNKQKPEEMADLPIVADKWKETEMGKTNQKYEKLSDKILSWEDKMRKKARRKLNRTERGIEKTKMKARQRFMNENQSIGIISANARANATENRRREESKVKEKANLMRKTGGDPTACL